MASASGSRTPPGSRAPSDRPPYRRRHYPRVPASNVVQRPQPQNQQDPRSFELTQLQRRFNCGTGSGDGTTFMINLRPSDPDFVYSIDVLKLRLTVPLDYRGDGNGKPSIEVLNSEIPVGYRVNVERGFQELVETKPEATLLALMNALDRGLERILGGEKAETVKIVPNLTPSTLTPQPPPPPAPVVPVREEFAKMRPPAPIVTNEQRAMATAKRNQETRHLESRLKLSDVFSKSSDGIEYVVPLEPRKKDLLPVPLHPVRSVRLIVPLSYDLQPARIELMGVPENIKNRVEQRFSEFVEENRGVSLTATINILAARLHIWAAGKEGVDHMKTKEIANIESLEETKETKEAPTATAEETFLSKSHVKVIPRPPEWSLPDGGEDGSGDEDEYSDFEDTSGEEELAHNKEAATADDVPHPVQERGTSLSCPGISMSGIELLEVLALNVNIKCMRCKTERETLNLRGTPAGMPAKPQAFRCEKCSEILGIGFRKDFIHQNSHRLGFFDLTNCTIVEILPSSFTPQCGGCSSLLPAPGIKDLVCGQSVSMNCRECHRKMGLYIPEFKLLRITQGGDLNLEKLPLKKKKDQQRYVAGTELPHKGRCKHYRKSTRWFRFSCCSKVFPCDRCHDQIESHPSEHANKMICGLCSREQNYRPDDCRFCGNCFFVKRLSHYWEGGKGTRDKRLMARNDPRKYKRIGKPAE
ncbi:hypothetical protein K440DRAFT_585355 [Wilcoxina mikolae CBS 423.85]|nr:hypothetical protein K440DRAFT_585355 [Wilcoxina mikolae CBS 423.85]